nr:F-box protein At1g19070-like [Aegilops tauschii subsp. strangulata]
MSGGGGDLFGALPDELLRHVLSFLPSRDAVHTSLLSRRWRHLCRSAPAIHVRGEGDAFCVFVNSLLMGRDAASAPPLRSFEIDANLKKLRDCNYCEYKPDYCRCEFFYPYSDRRKYKIEQLHPGPLIRVVHIHRNMRQPLP